MSKGRKTSKEEEKNRDRKRRVMTIGGSDCSGGAGIQADLKTFSALGVYGTSVITAITAQNSFGVQEKKKVPTKLVKAQIESILSDRGIGVDYAKTGMLYSKEIIKLVAEELRRYNIPFVLDPVIKAGSGDVLLEDSALNSLLKHLLPVSSVVTPNIIEAGIISGMAIRNKQDAKESAVKIFEMGAPVVIIKGGHLQQEMAVGRATDLIYYDGAFEELSGEYVMIEGRVHGAGCSFSAALAAELAKGKNMREAALSAKKFVYDAILGGEKVSNSIVVNQAYSLYKDADRFWTLENIKEAVKMLKNEAGFKNLIPEVGTNIGMGVEGAESEGDIAAIDGRIVPTRDGIRVGYVDFGVSDHIARIILAAMQFDKEKRSAINIKYSSQIIEACKESGLRISSFEREKEAKLTKTMDWGIKEAIKEVEKGEGGFFPDVIYDFGAIGKEPMIRIFANTAMEVVSKVKKIMEALE